MTITITKAKAIELLNKAVEEKGADYQYPGWQDGECLYSTTEGAPSCIVGYAINYLDPDLFQKVEEFEDYNGATGIDSLYDQLLRDEGVKITPKALNVLETVQNFQDRGEPWGYAVRVASK